MPDMIMLGIVLAIQAGGAGLLVWGPVAVRSLRARVAILAGAATLVFGLSRNLYLSILALLVVGGLKNMGRAHRDTGWGESLYWLFGGDRPGAEWNVERGRHRFERHTGAGDQCFQQHVAGTEL